MNFEKKLLLNFCKEFFKPKLCTWGLKIKSKKNKKEFETLSEKKIGQIESSIINLVTSGRKMSSGSNQITLLKMVSNVKLK